MGETRRKFGKDFREGDGALSEDERVELARLRRENAELANERCAQAQRGTLAEGRDGAVASVAFIAAQRDEHQIPHAVACRALTAASCTASI